MQHIAILDFGSQYTHLIARQIRDLEVLAKIYPADSKANDIAKDCDGIIISGGPQSVYAKNALMLDLEILKSGKPILGLCYGEQLIAHLLGGAVKPGKKKEYGKAELKIIKPGALFKNIKTKSIVWMSHGDAVKKLPANFKILASTADCPIAAMADEEKKIYGLQFHPEVHHSQEGQKIISNFVLNICKSQKEWRVADLIASLIKKIKKQAKNKKVFVLVSGGVDSTVAFSLLTRALGKKRVQGLYIDTGFMRLGESEEIKKSLAEAGFVNLEFMDASVVFFQSLKNISDPEEKRKIIGQVFLDAKDKAFVELKLNSSEWILGQGTIYPDTIESGGTEHADTIKTHHNRINAIEKMIEQGLVIEPLADFYKDEVREIGYLLGLPENLIKRQPFPGPGLAIRCLCFDSQDKIENFKLKIKNNLLKNLKHAILPIKSVGVQGDNRTYAHPLLIWGESNWKKLDQISREITNSYSQINRVLLFLNPPKNKAQFIVPAKNYFLDRERIQLLQKIDAIVSAQVKDAGIYDQIWQFPVVLIPVLGENRKESIVLRPIISREAMTADFYQLPKKVLDKIVKEILKTGEIDYIFYDITNKPPATIEWE